MKKFDQSKGSEQFSLMKVKRTYGDFPLKIKQVFNEKTGWTNVDMVANCQNVWYFAMGLATIIQFEVIDEWDMVRYPDYRINELLK